MPVTNPLLETQYVMVRYSNTATVIRASRSYERPQRERLGCHARLGQQCTSNNNHFPSLNFSFNVFGTCLIVKDTRVPLLKTSPIATGVPRCLWLAISLVMVSSSLASAIPWRYLVYMLSWRMSKLLGSRRRERRYLDSRLASPSCRSEETCLDYGSTISNLHGPAKQLPARSSANCCIAKSWPN